MKTPLLLALVLATAVAAQAELKVPGYTAYLNPTDSGAEISTRNGITGWDNSAQKVLWFGELKHSGKLQCALALRLANGSETKLRLTVAGASREATAKGDADGRASLDFGAFDIAAAGYQGFTLESLNGAGKDAGAIESLNLSGAAAADAHFNLKPGRGRAASSVHLAFPVTGLGDVDAFYSEVTATETPIWSYFEACGWHRGYFGMQVNSPTERRIIFSVWDSGGEPVTRSKVQAEDRVTLVAKGADVDAGDFGGEGTGGHSHLVYNWKTGEKQRFLTTAKRADATHTVYAGYWFHPEKKKWILISSWQAPKDGGYLHGLYSFIEDFNGDNGQLHRKGLYGNQWLHTTDGQWHEATKASFSHDPTGRADRLDRFMGVEDGQFFLSTGGYIPGYTTFGTVFTRPATGKVPSDLTLTEFALAGLPRVAE